MSDAGARDFHRRWATIAVPLRPPPEAVAAMAALVADRTGRSLQLGVTPEIAGIAARSVAIDWEERMVRLAWPAARVGPAHAAIVADWRALPIAAGTIATVIGDGSLSVIAWPPTALCGELARVLAPGARIVMRCFAAPDRPETLADLAAAARSGGVGSFSAFKLRFNMAVFAAAGGTGAIMSQDLFASFGRVFPDRAGLARANGWDASEVARIDAYAGGLSLHAYPSRAAIAAALPWPVRFVEVGGYELAERCPLLVVDLPG